MTKRIRAALALSTLIAGCSAGPRLDQLDAEGLFAYATERYRAEKWTEAVDAFQRFTFEYPTHPRYQEARFMLAETYYGQEQYITAANEYARLANDFPAGPWVDDARFKLCESYYRLSPRVELDQEYSQAAIDHCQALQSYHPGSPFETRALEIISEMTEKLAQKLWLTGQYYERRDALDSAILYYTQTVDRYPMAQAAPRALLRLVRVYQELDYAQEGQAARERLLRDYPNSTEARELGGGTGA